MNNNQLDELKLKRYCDEHKYKYNYFGDCAIITTNLDEWRLQTIESYQDGVLTAKIKVDHYNRSGNKKGKMQFHPQRNAYDLDYIFNNIIIPHEGHDRVYQKAFRIKELLALHI